MLWLFRVWLTRTLPWLVLLSIWKLTSTLRLIWAKRLSLLDAILGQSHLVRHLLNAWPYYFIRKLHETLSTVLMDICIRFHIQLWWLIRKEKQLMREYFPWVRFHTLIGHYRAPRIMSSNSPLFILLFSVPLIPLRLLGLILKKKFTATRLAHINVAINVILVLVGIL